MTASRGDDAALAALIGTYRDRVHRYGRRVCRDGYDADDAVQEAFSRIARRPDVQADRGVLGWLLTVVRNACLRLLRPARREQRVLGERCDPTDVQATLDLDPEAALARGELVRTVHAAIAALARPYREVIVMRDLEGRSGDETCAALGVSRATMKTRLHRARAQLRATLRLDMNRSEESAGVRRT